MTHSALSTSARGYGWAHQRERERWRPTVVAGRAYCREVVCVRGSRWIRPGTAWDLAHNRRTGGYLGPAHRQCNRAEGARWRGHLRRVRRAGLAARAALTQQDPSNPGDTGSSTPSRWAL